MWSAHLLSTVAKHLAITYIVYIVTLQGEFAAARPSLTIIPRTAHISNEDIVTVMCVADRRLIGCQFHLKVDGDYLMDFSGGAGTVDGRYHSWYHGSGLGNGQCGMKMRRPELSGLYVLGCRVRSEIGGWVYADMTLYVYSRDKSRTEPFALVENYPEKVIVLPGEQLRVAYTLKSHTVLMQPSATCTFSVQGIMSLIESNRGQEGIDDFQTYGHSSSQCGIEISHVKKEYNGWLWGSVRTSNKEDRYPFPKIALIVAEAPTMSDITLNITTHTQNQGTNSDSRSVMFEEGDTLSASCQATNSRPVSNITWHFGDDVIRRDSDDDSPITNEWVWDYEKQTIMQNISRKLSWQDDGKELVCQITHMGLEDEEGLSENVIINVNIAKSNHIPTKLMQGDFTVGHIGVIVVDTDHWGIPRPTFLWRVNNITVREEESDWESNHFHAQRAEQKDGKWIASLVIYSVWNEDDKHSYLLIAGDDGERREYLVNITVVDLKVQYFLVTLFCSVLVVFLIASVIYYKDISHWYMHAARNNGGRMMYNSGRILYSPERRNEEQYF